MARDNVRIPSPGPRSKCLSLYHHATQNNMRRTSNITIRDKHLGNQQCYHLYTADANLDLKRLKRKT
ncbi:hypothetical protein RRG08_031824 [Elysia crispata]|uniref:Uncharacterized protein n=1 Tax=Elysia crispata TaxID=231223 RepID=A0AAE1CT64_9GAST|nr:hypothetical protein RRG08_031824 [Elysia crispata]